MIRQIKGAVVTLLLMTVITGVFYPLAVTVLAQVVFPAQANGSLIMANGAVVGSSLIGQANDDPRYFWPRPSATGYNPLPSSGSNLGPTSAALLNLVSHREADFTAANSLAADAIVPPDMVFASGSGLDPHISPEAARLQIDRVADTRGIDRQAVAELVEDYVEQPQFGFLGQPRVNTLMLNLALDQLQ